MVGVDIVAGEIRGQRRHVFRPFGKVLHEGVKLLIGQVCEDVGGAAEPQEGSQIRLDREPLRGGLRVKGLSGFGCHVFEKWVHRGIMP